MSARPICTIAMLMHTAKTLLVLMAVLVSKDSKVMVGRAVTLMNVRIELTGVTGMRNAQTLKALTNAPVFQGFMVTVKCVETSTNVWLDHMAAF